LLLLAAVFRPAPAAAVRLIGEIFLGDLNDVFFGAGDRLVLVIDPATGATTIDEAASAVTMLGEPVRLRFSGTFDTASGVYTGQGEIDAPQVSIVTPTDHADGELREAGGGAGGVDILDGVGAGAPFSLFMNGGCDAVPAVGTSTRAIGARHFVECAISLFLSGFVVDEDFGDVDCATAPAGAQCEDGDACTASDVCAAGVCVSGSARGCDDGDACTIDACDPVTGCLHDGGDADGDGVCDRDDNCPRTVNADQTDTDPVDGIGDACECRAASPGHCVPGAGGRADAECHTEFRVDPVPPLDGRDRRLGSRVECTDGAPCDFDGMADRSCRFRVALCFNNRDPRLACLPSVLETFRLRAPQGSSPRPHEAQAATTLLAAVTDAAPATPEGRRGGQMRLEPPLAGLDVCTRPVTLAVPLVGRRSLLRIVTRTAGAADGETRRPLEDDDRLSLVCHGRE
jgi:hypothetical protein